MRLTAPDAAMSPRVPRRWRRRLAALLIGAAAAAGCASFDSQQRQWIFQPTHKTWWAGAHDADGMQDVWIEFTPSHPAAHAWWSFTDDGAAGPQPVKLHGLWMPQPDPHAPVLLYLHGARWDVLGSASRIRRMHDLGFSVLGIDYRGFGRSTATTLPSETMAYQDARAAWDWLARQRPGAKRYVFGHSLGGAIAVNLAKDVSDASGLIVEGTFTSIRDVLGTMKWGWLPIGGLITQRFEAGEAIASVKAPVLVVHGSDDQLIPPELGRALYDRATARKRFVLVEGGSHHNTNAVGQAQYREALADFFGLPTL